MAREHHCPNCGPQACNASTSKIHTCGVCAAIWEEDLSVAPPVPAPRPAAPAVPAPAAAQTAPKPAATAPAAPPPTASGGGAPTSGPAAPGKPAAPVPPNPAPTPAPSATPPTPVKPAAPPAAAAPVAPSAATKPPAPATAGTLSGIVAAAKVKRCPKCQSDSLAAPLDFQQIGGRVVLQDSQTYRGHWWYADTGDVYAPPGAAAPSSPAPAARPAPAPQPAA